MDPFLVVDLCLDAVDGVGRLDVQCERLASDCLGKYLPGKDLPEVGWTLPVAAITGASQQLGLSRRANKGE